MNTKLLTVRLFGSFLLLKNEQEVSTLSRAAKHLLALLILRRDNPQTRASLAGLIWQDAMHERGLFYLRRCLTELRAALGSERGRLISDLGTLHFETTGMMCDVLDFEKLMTQKDEAGWGQAVALYRGCLLEGNDADWLAGERERFAAQYLTALEALAALQEQRGAFPEALELLRRVTLCEPSRESAHCRIMEILGNLGNFAGVERQYRELRRVLHTELNLEPSADTVQCYARLKTQSQSVLPVSPPPASPRRRLPCPLTSFIGRKQERTEIAAALQSYRLVTLLGPGGVGKTRLAITVADEVTPSYTDGVWFVDLAPVIRADTLPQVIIDSLGSPPARESEPLESLCHFLQRKHLLLILDNAEHLHEVCGVSAKLLLQECSLLTILCTSREPLGISGEALRSVAPLAVPPENTTHSSLSDEEILAYDSVALLRERITAVAPKFPLTANNISTMVQISRRLEGLPLALELVAARFRSLSASDIAARLDDQFRLLTGGDPSVPRHQTLRATLDWSYDLLSETERRLLRSISVFVDGWTLEAAEAVCQNGDADIFALTLSLVDKSLIIVEEQRGQTRYRLLEMTRIYAAEQLPTEENMLVRRHAEYFMRKALQADEQNRNNELFDSRDPLRAEQGNFRAAHSWWLIQDAEQALWLELFLYKTWIWTITNKREWIDRVARAEPTWSVLGAQLNYLTACWAMWLGDPVAERLLRQAIEIAETCHSDYWAIHAWYILSEWYTENGQVDEALACIETVLASYRQDQMPHLFAYFQAEAAVLMMLCGDIAPAQQRLQTLLHNGRHTGDWRTLFSALAALAKCAFTQEQYGEAYAYWSEYLPLAEQYQPFLAPEGWRQMGRAAREQGEYTEAQLCFDNAVITSRAQSRKDREAWTYCGSAELAFRQDRIAEALAQLSLAVTLFDELDEPRSVSFCLRTAAEYHQKAGHNERASVILGSVEQIHSEYGFGGMTSERAAMLQLEEKLQTQLGQDAWASLKKQGARMPLTQAIQYAFAEDSMTR